MCQKFTFRLFPIGKDYVGKGIINDVRNDIVSDVVSAP